MGVEGFEIGRLDFPKRDTLEATHCFLPNDQRSHAGRMTHRSPRHDLQALAFATGYLLRLLRS
jgi:hypothetical protein